MGTKNTLAVVLSLFIGTSVVAMVVRTVRENAEEQQRTAALARRSPSAAPPVVKAEPQIETGDNAFWLCDYREPLQAFSMTKSSGSARYSTCRAEYTGETPAPRTNIKTAASASPGLK